MCGNCGTYRGKEIVDVVAKKERKIAKRKEKARLLGKEEAAEK